MAKRLASKNLPLHSCLIMLCTRHNMTAMHELGSLSQRTLAVLGNLLQCEQMRSSNTSEARHIGCCCQSKSYGNSPECLNISHLYELRQAESGRCHSRTDPSPEADRSS